MLSVLWAGKELQSNDIGELHQMMSNYYGPGINKCLEQGTQVDQELKSLFKNLMPTPMQINLYFGRFCTKYNIDITKFNSIGHQATTGDDGDDHDHKQGPTNPHAPDNFQGNHSFHGNDGMGGGGGLEQQMVMDEHDQMLQQFDQIPTNVVQPQMQQMHQQQVQQDDILMQLERC